MSASLVGSEMCIRDRSNAELFPERWAMIPQSYTYPGKTQRRKDRRRLQGASLLRARCREQRKPQYVYAVS
eukprot:7878946-Alexandrium_andersonii.AAC.1